MVSARPDRVAVYRIMIAVGGADQYAVSLALAVPLARARRGVVIPLYVTDRGDVPEWLVVPPDLRDVVVPPLVVDRRDIAMAILNAVREQEADLLLLHWKGQPSRGRYLLGPTLDPVIQYAPCDVGVIRLGMDPQAFVERMAHLRRILVPMGDGPNAALALQLALEIGADAQITALRVANTNLGPTAISAQWDILQHTLKHRGDTERIKSHVELAPRVLDGILGQAGQGYDLVFIGASQERLIDRLLFGNLPQALALKMPVPLLIVRHHDPVAVGALRRARWRLLQALPQLTLEERIAIYRHVRRNARSETDFYVMTTISAVIASLGLLLNSPAVIIGAMLVAPLMSALLGVSLGVVQGDNGLLRLSLRTLILEVLLVLGVSGVAAMIMPASRITAEMLGRSQPSLLDLGVALASGAAAAYAVSRKEVASALAGVSIAVALVPPLSTVGLAAVFRAWPVAWGALLLFLTNLVAIVSAASIFFLWMGFRPNTGQRARARTFRGGVLGVALLLASITLILAGLTLDSIHNAVWRNTAQRVLAEQIAHMGPGISLADWAFRSESGVIAIDVVVQATRQVSYREVSALQERMAEALQRQVALTMTVIPVTRLDPLAPASPTPTPAPS